MDTQTIDPDLAIRELRHRTANVFATLQALIRRERMAACGGCSSLARLEAQLNAYQILDAMTVESGTDESVSLDVVLGELVAQLQSTIFHGIDAQIDFAAAPIRIDPARAHGLSLMLIELASNAAKHALAKRSGGHWWVILANAQDRRWTLEVRDDGPGFDHEAPTGRSGMKLLQGMSKNIGAQLSIERRDDGMTHRIEFLA